MPLNGRKASKVADQLEFGAWCQDNISPVRRKPVMNHIQQERLYKLDLKLKLTTEQRGIQTAFVDYQIKLVLSGWCSTVVNCVQDSILKSALGFSQELLISLDVLFYTYFTAIGSNNMTRQALEHHVQVQISGQRGGATAYLQDSGSARSTDMMS